jgi:hypothetical protein
MPGDPFWEQTEGPDLAQGDYLPGCLVPIIDLSFFDEAETRTVAVKDVDLIVVTQSCDLVPGAKIRQVVLCPVYSIDEFEGANPNYQGKQWNQVRKGRVEGLHLVASPTQPDEARASLVIDFRDIHSLPIEYVRRRAEELGIRWRLRSPYVEHLSQAFARFFMRVGLPTQIPEFK